jgi:hypothetical protein
MSEKRKVLTTNGACEILNCTPAWFHRKHKLNLTRLPSIDNKAYYDYDEVISLKDKYIIEKEKKSIYNVVK